MTIRLLIMLAFAMSLTFTVFSSSVYAQHDEDNFRQDTFIPLPYAESGNPWDDMEDPSQRETWEDLPYNKRRKIIEKLDGGIYRLIEEIYHYNRKVASTVYTIEIGPPPFLQSFHECSYGSNWDPNHGYTYYPTHCDKYIFYKDGTWFEVRQEYNLDGTAYVWTSHTYYKKDGTKIYSQHCRFSPYSNIPKCEFSGQIPLPQPSDQGIYIDPNGQ